MGEILERPPAPARHQAERRRLLQDGRGRHSDRPPSRRTDRRRDHRHARHRQSARRDHKQARRLFSRALRDEVALVSVQSPLRLDAYNEPEPDLMLLRPRADGYRASHPGAADVLLLVEVSESSWPTIAAPSSRYTQDSAFQRSGSSILLACGRGLSRTSRGRLCVTRAADNGLLAPRSSRGRRSMSLRCSRERSRSPGAWNSPSQRSGRPHLRV